VWHASSVTWLDEFAGALDLEPLRPQERRLLLDLARDVAHRTERVNAPLASYLVGRFTAARSDGVEAIREAAGRAALSLPPPAGEPGDR
jgi:hypothetical protein